MTTAITSGRAESFADIEQFSRQLQKEFKSILKGTLLVHIDEKLDGDNKKYTEAWIETVSGNRVRKTIVEPIHHAKASIAVGQMYKEAYRICGVELTGESTSTVAQRAAKTRRK